MEEDGGAAVRTKMVRRGCATAAGTVMTDVSAAAMRWCERGGVAVLMVVDGDGAAGALQVKVARRRKMVVVEARGCCCFWQVSVVAGEEMAAAAAMVGGREIRVRVSCVRWRR